MASKIAPIVQTTTPQAVAQVEAFILSHKDTLSGMRLNMGFPTMRFDAATVQEYKGMIYRKSIIRMAIRNLIQRGVLHDREEGSCSFHTRAHEAAQFQATFSASDYDFSNSRHRALLQEMLKSEATKREALEKQLL